MSTSSTSGCGCGAAAEQLSAVADREQRRVLLIVLAINVTLFVGEFGAGWWAESTALQADSLDSLGDAGVYALSLFVVRRSMQWRAGTAVVKGVIQGLFGLAVLTEVARKAVFGAVPDAPIMAVVAAIAFAANLTCFVLLTRFRDRDINLRSVWLCSRNDLFNNVGVIAAAAAVAWLGRGWPDLVVGALVAALFLHTSYDVLRTAIRQLRQPAPAPVASQMRTGMIMGHVIREAFNREWQLSLVARGAGDLERAFGHLERAHILGQRSTPLHVRSHVGMLGIAWQRRDPREIAGQLARIVAAALFSRLWVPIGNTGGANVSATRPMPVPTDLQAILDADRR